jgi:hypothetical protein
MNNRRKLVVALGAGALTASFASFAQQPGKVWRIGILYPGSQSDSNVLAVTLRLRVRHISIPTRSLRFLHAAACNLYTFFTAICVKFNLADRWRSTFAS